MAIGAENDLDRVLKTKQLFSFLFISDISSLTAGIPDHIRASILRLSEQQAEEEEEEMRIEREEAAYRRERAGRRGESGRGGGGGKGNTTALQPEKEEMESEDDNETEDERAMGRGVVDDGDESDEGGDILAKGVSLYVHISLPKINDAEVHVQ